MKNSQELNKDKIPRHIAIIMDGNGRWAKLQNKERCYGHQVGADVVHKIAEKAARLGVKYLTLYTFSSENWNRPTDEIAALMDLLLASIDEELLTKNDIRFKVIGEYNKLPIKVQERLSACESNTKENKTMTLVLALSYSSYWEITEATKKIATLVSNNKLSVQDITPETIQQNLDTNFMPNPDLLIRTGGEVRLSNYLLWQCAYTELYFSDIYWPSFTENDLVNAIIDYQNRERRFGKTSEQINQ